MSSNGEILTGRREGVRGAVTALWLCRIVFGYVSVRPCVGCSAGRGLFYGLAPDVDVLLLCERSFPADPLISGAVLPDLTCAALARTHEVEATSSSIPACPLRGTTTVRETTAQTDSVMPNVCEASIKPTPRGGSKELMAEI